MSVTSSAAVGPAAWDQRGYIFTSGDGYDIMGWRKDQQHVAAFYFTSLHDSYAARTGRLDNVGVIGVALFRRKMDKPPTGYALPGNENESILKPPGAEKKFEDSAAPAPRQSMQLPSPAAGMSPESAALAKEKSLGTGHGRRVDSSVQFANFERAAHTPDEVISIYYDSYRNLAARGVIPPQPIAANPFPQQFVPDPPRRWWP